MKAHQVLLEEVDIDVPTYLLEPQGNQSPDGVWHYEALRNWLRENHPGWETFQHFTNFFPGVGSN